MAAARGLRSGGGASLKAVIPVIPAVGASAAASAVTLPGIFFVFCKTGAVLFGSGYVLLAFLRADLVERLHWMTEAQLIKDPDRGWTSDAEDGVHDGDLHRLSALRTDGGVGGDGGYLPARLRVRRAERPAGTAPPGPRRARERSSTA